MSMSSTMVEELGIEVPQRTRDAKKLTELSNGGETNSLPSDVYHDSRSNEFENSVTRARSVDTHEAASRAHQTVIYSDERIENLSDNYDVMIEQHRGPLWTPGVIGFSGIVGKVEPVKIRSSEQLRSLLDEVLRNLGPTRSTDWKARCDAIQMFRGIIAAGKGDCEEIMAAAKPLREALAEQVCDLRSQIVKIGCCAVAELSAAMTSRFEIFANSLVSNLLKLVINSVSIMASSGHEAILSIIHNAALGFHRMVPLICKHVQDSRSSKLRSCCGEYLLNMTRGWSKSILEKHKELLAKTIKSLVVDADEDARKIGRLTFWSYYTLFEEDASYYVYHQIDLATQKLIEQNEDEARRNAHQALRRPITQIPSSGTFLTTATTQGTQQRPIRQRPPVSHPPDNHSAKIDSSSVNSTSGVRTNGTNTTVSEETDENTDEWGNDAFSFNNVVRQAQKKSAGYSSNDPNTTAVPEKSNVRSPEDYRKEVSQRTADEIDGICYDLDSGVCETERAAVIKMSKIAQILQSQVMSKSTTEIEAYRNALISRGPVIFRSLCGIIPEWKGEAEVDALVALDSLLKCDFAVKSFRDAAMQNHNWLQQLQDLLFALLKQATVKDESVASTAADVLRESFTAIGAKEYLPVLIDLLGDENDVQSAALELLRVILSTPQGQLFFCGESVADRAQCISHMIHLMENCCALMIKSFHARAITAGIRNLFESLYRVNKEFFTEACFGLSNELQHRIFHFLETYSNQIYHNIHPSNKVAEGVKSSSLPVSGTSASSTTYRPPPAVNCVQRTPETKPREATQHTGVTPNANIPSFSSEELITSQQQLSEVLSRLTSSRGNLLKDLHLVGHVVVSKDISRQQLWKVNRSNIIKAILTSLTPTSVSHDSNPMGAISAGLAILRRISRFHAEDVTDPALANMVVTELLHTASFYHDNKEIIFSLQKTIDEFIGCLDPLYLALPAIKRALMGFKRNTGENRGDAPEEVIPTTVALKALRELLATHVLEGNRLTKEDVLQLVLDPGDQFMSAVRNVFLSTVADLRKNLVLTMVEICLICGDDIESSLHHHLSDPQRKLLAIYVQRAKRTRNME